jgi:hypothetical protein
MRLLTAASLLAVAACIVPAPTSEKAPEALKPPAPLLEVRNGANLGGKVEIVGAQVAPGRINPGESAKVTVFFKVLDSMTADYMIFVHVEDAEGRVDRINADHAPMGGQRPTSTWKVGELLRDEFSVYVPPGMPVRGLNLLMGLWDPKTDARLPLTNPSLVRNDGNNRITIASIPVGNN